MERCASNFSMLWFTTRHREASHIRSDAATTCRPPLAPEQGLNATRVHVSNRPDGSQNEFFPSSVAVTVSRRRFSQPVPCVFERVAWNANKRVDIRGVLVFDSHRRKQKYFCFTIGLVRFRWNDAQCKKRTELCGK